MPAKLNVKLIGVGGIGQWVVNSLVLLLQHQPQDPIHLTLIDGDSYGEENRGRQMVGVLGNKAVVARERCLHAIPVTRVVVRVQPLFLSRETASLFIEEGDLVLCAPDNHFARRIASEQCSQLQNACLIAGGNDGLQGNVIIYCRRGGKDITRPVADPVFHPEIANAVIEDECAGCQEIVARQPQVIQVNMAVAMMMVHAAHLFLDCQPLPDEVYVDLKTWGMRAAFRSTPEGSVPLS